MWSTQRSVRITGRHYHVEGVHPGPALSPKNGPRSGTPFQGSVRQWADQIITATIDHDMNGFVYWSHGDIPHRKAAGDDATATGRYWRRSGPVAVRGRFREHARDERGVRLEFRTELQDAFVSLACGLVCWMRLKKHRSMVVLQALNGEPSNLIANIRTLIIPHRAAR